MHKPSGMTVVTAGLGALALFGVVWSSDTKRAEHWPQPSLPTATLDIGTTFQLHSGAWRAWPAPVEEAPATAQTPMPAALLAPEAPAGTDGARPAPEAPAAIPTASLPPPVRKVPVQQISRREVPTASPPQERADGQLSEPSVQPVDKAPAAPTPPPAEGRMALSGPDAEAVRPPAGYVGHAVRPTATARSAPRGQVRDPEPDAVPPSVPKFGPEALKKLEHNGF